MISVRWSDAWVEYRFEVRRISLRNTAEGGCAIFFEVSSKMPQ